MALRDIFDSRLFRPRNLIPAAFAAVFSIVAWFGIEDFLFGSDPPPTPQVEVTQPVEETVEEPEPAVEEPAPVVDDAPVFPRILVARRRINSGVMIVSDFVEWREWRDAIDLELSVLQDSVPMQAIIGSVTTRPYDPGVPIAWDGIIAPGGQGFIGAVLAPGMRAVTVEVDRATTNANIIYPGDRVDVIMVSEESRSEGAGPAAQAIVRGARVLAVGSTIVALGRYGTVSLTQAGAVQPVTPPEGDNYTLEVSPIDAERVALATATGRLTLAMRSVSSSEPVHDREVRPAVRLTEIIVEPEPPPPPPVVPPVRVIRGRPGNATNAVES